MERNNNESCSKQSQSMSQTYTETPTIAIVGIVSSLVVVLVFGFIAIRKWMQNHKEEGSVDGEVDNNPHYGESEYEDGEGDIVIDRL